MNVKLSHNANKKSTFILCASCKIKKGDKRSSGCQSTYYSSQNCQKSHWKQHKSKCKKIRRKQTKKKSNNVYQNVAKGMFNDKTKWSLYNDESKLPYTMIVCEYS